MGEESGRQTLSSLLAQGARLPHTEALRIARSLLDELRKLHEAGTIHRNLHPGCVLLRPDGGVVLAGLELAKKRGVAVPDPAGAMSGQIRTFAPEQVLGEATDERTDLYQVGLILYHLFTGRPAFETQGMWSLAKRISSEDPVAPNRVDPSIPQGLSGLIAKSLSRNPADRFASAADFSGQLARIS